MNKLKEFLLSNRLKSLYWRTGCMFAVAFLNALSESLGGFGLSGQSLVFAGLVLGEVTKALNNFLAGKSA